MNFPTSLLEKFRIPDWVLIFLLLLGALLRFYGLDRTLGTTGLGGFDEGVDLRFYHYAPFNFIVTNYFIPYQPPLGMSHHIFHSLLAHLMVVLFGEDNEIAIRMPVFLFGMGSLWLIYRIAFQLFHSLIISRIALLAATLSPIHIAYSQTARGYALIIFFSAAMIYSSIKLIESKKCLKWGIILTLSGFLSTYTIPTNVYFAFGLALWIVTVLSVPNFRMEYGLDLTAAKLKARFFFISFLVMGLLTLVAYWPVLDQVQQASNSHTFQFIKFYGDHPVYIDAVITMKNFLLLVFSGPWKWLLPLLALGILFGPVKGGSVKSLPVIVFLMPFILSLSTKVVGYPKVYLYNFPLLMVFFAAGMVWLIRMITNKLPYFLKKQSLIYVLGVVLILSQGSYLASEYYPSLETFNGKTYQSRLKSQTKANDLILIPDVLHHLYARPVYQDRLMNIITDNRLSGIKVIAASRSIFDRFVLNNEENPKGYPLFYNLNKSLLLPEKILVDRLNVPAPATIFSDDDPTAVLNRRIPEKGRKLFAIPLLNSRSILTKDFEILANWNLALGNGHWAINNENYIAGNGSLALNPTLDKEMVVSVNLPEISIKRKNYLVICWGSHRPEGNNWDGFIFPPALRFKRLEAPDVAWETRMGRVNQGMIINTSKSPYLHGPHWYIGTTMGMLPAGNYNFTIILKASAGKPVLYDGLKLFLLEAK